MQSFNEILFLFLKNGKGIELLKIQHTAPSGAIWRLVFGGLNNKRLIWVFVRSSVNELCFFFSFNSFQSLISHNWIRCKISCVAIKFEFFVWFFFYVMWNLYFTILKFCNVIWYFALSCSYLVNSTFYWIAVHSENPRLLTRNSILCCIFLKSCYVLTINIFISVNKVIYIGFKKDVFIF